MLVVLIIHKSVNRVFPTDCRIDRQFPEPQQPYQPINTNTRDEMNTLEVIGANMDPPETKTEAPMKDEGFLDSYFGDGAQSRIVGSINNWIVDKAKTNPGNG